MNYKGEPYPEDINKLISRSNKAIEFLMEKLQHKDCKRLDELYLENTKNKKIYKHPQIAHSLVYDMKNVDELKGLYLFAEVTSKKKINPVYVGISRSISRRLKQHGWGKSHNHATWAYSMAANEISHTSNRKDLSIEHIQRIQAIIRNCKVAVIQESNDYDLSFMEVYIAGKLKTKWNSFKTH